VKQKPHQKQALFLLHDGWFEGLYGGAAGGAKSSALLMAAAADVETPGYSALILRESFTDLNQADALIPRSREWWGDTPARYSERDHRWTFPSGATITFGYLERDPHVYQYQGAALQFVGVDELTQHTEFRYTYLSSRIRRPSYGPLSRVPLRLRGATNPGNKGHEWVKKRFLPSDFLRSKDPAKFDTTWYHRDRFFVPSRLEDNPSLDAALYDSQSLALLLPVVRQQLREGDWQAHEGGHIKREWFQHYDDLGDAYYISHTHELAKHEWCQVVVCVDPAGGESDSADYTAIVVCAITPLGSILVVEVVRERLAVEKIVPRLAEVCRRRRPAYVGIEGNFAQSQYVRQARQTPGIPTVQQLDPGGNSKLVRATPLIVRCQAGGVFLPRDAPWLDDFTGELTAFTGDEKLDAHDDQVDAMAYLVHCVDRYSPRRDDGPAVFGRRGQ
jgi:predicted phage terminase large subunit-like protein